MLKEDWKYTQLDEWKAIDFAKRKPVNIEQCHPRRRIAEQFEVDGSRDHLVFINGIASKTDSTMSFESAPSSDTSKNDLIADLNQENRTDDLSVTLDGETLYIYYLIEAKKPTISAPRIQINTTENSHSRIVEIFSVHGQHSHCNSLEVHCAQHSTLKHFKLQNDDLNAFHLSTIRVTQDQDSVFASMQIQLGAKLSRQDIFVEQAQERCETHLKGLYISHKNQHMDTHTRIDHKKPNGKSSEHYKGIAADSSQAVFNGKIVVHEGADQTDSTQSNKNLLLSSKAEIDTKPELEIYADDVKCAHGATVGELNEKALFYLQSRGIPLHQAKSVLLHAFAADILEHIEDKDLHKTILKLVDEDLEEIEHDMGE